MTKSLLAADYNKLELRVAGTQTARIYPVGLHTIQGSAIYRQIKRVVHATDKAYLVETDEGEGWIPKACCALLPNNLMLIDNDFNFVVAQKFEEEEPPCPYCGSYTYCRCAL